MGGERGGGGGREEELQNATHKNRLLELVSLHFWLS